MNSNLKAPNNTAPQVNISSFVAAPMNAITNVTKNIANNAKNVANNAKNAATNAANNVANVFNKVGSFE